VIRLLLLLAVLALASCGDRAWPQRAADLRAAALAAGQAKDATTCDRILRALAADVVALTATMPGLPAPTWTPDEITADPEPYAASTADPAPAYQPPAPPKPPGPSPAERLRQLGDRVLVWGGIAAAIGAALLLVGVAGRFLPLGWVGSLVASPVVAPLARLAASLGGASVAIGAAMSWLADWLWLVVLVGVLTGVVVAWFHRRGLAAAWRKILAVKGRVG
jgi:hypothetical protein